MREGDDCRTTLREPRKLRKRSAGGALVACRQQDRLGGKSESAVGGAGAGGVRGGLGEDGDGLAEGELVPDALARAGAEGAEGVVGLGLR